MQMHPNKDTQLCMSLSARPGNFGLRFHNHLYEQLGLNFYYKAFSSQDLPGAIGGIRALGVRGCGVSMPFKEAAIALVDELDASVRQEMDIRPTLAHVWKRPDGHLVLLDFPWPEYVETPRGREWWIPATSADRALANQPSSICYYASIQSRRGNYSLTGKTSMK